MTNKTIHNFHIPVMGLAYTIDTPIRVAHYGISSVISIIDDDLIERMRELYSRKFNFNYTAISVKADDYRSRRITAYLDMMDEIVNRNFIGFKKELSTTRETLLKFIEMLPSHSFLRKELKRFSSLKSIGSELKHFLDQHFFPGSIDVNIMTKVDKENFKNKKKLPVIHNDAHASLRGFAKSQLSSSVVFSAGMNPKLYSYIEEFEDFYPDANSYIKKKIILKVSDFRSAMIQGNFLAKKGLWVSEYRIESGLNCGGHAFATEGILLGTVLSEFKHRRSELLDSAYDLFKKALQSKSRPIPKDAPELKITVQGGVGTSEEHEFLLSNYQLNSIGWGSPFLLVPEATSVDIDTRMLLQKSSGDDFYLSDISPLGIEFNTIKGTTNEAIRQLRDANGRSGSSCPKKLLALHKGYSAQGLCTASSKYQKLKLNELSDQSYTMTDDKVVRNREKIIQKACLCVGLANATYLEHNMEIKGEQQGVVICPGPNLAYFDQVLSLAEMVQHIYGYRNVISKQRSHLFINELRMYIDYYKHKAPEKNIEMSLSDQKKWQNFKQNIFTGIAYYEKLFNGKHQTLDEVKAIKKEFEFILTSDRLCKS
ncbi:hypothetical protein [Epilithonimonas arachidiradicis]|uniref:Uncharacterized protein n=1 Tax=Epilithonimonas arachidiradicis TaxID=1617282 RepID=A0A420D8U2_9FLAO|nr:hypothetical protein [Epilithonimonas arachidiradicis]RKE87267.1 hypothetical protein BXY58_2148 [Epilithonimonas arachidiradicis]GGG59598.1 hypothetical protein GCM10007332_21590 [Epilithonimonas arachidiradicis]